MAPLALALGWAVGQPPLADFSWDADAFDAGLLAALPMLGLFALILRWPIGPLARIRQFFDTELALALEGCRWPDLALISVAAGLGEEMLFRGVIQAGMTRLLGRGVGVVAAGTLFGLLHPVSFAYVVLASALGVYLGVVWVVSGNLLAPIVAHAVYDFVALAVLLGTRKLSDGAGDD